MRLLMLAHGPSIHTRRWARALGARGHELLVLTAEPTPDPDAMTRVVGRWAPVAALRYWSARGAVREALRSFRPDVTVAHFLPDYGFLAAASGARPLLLACWGSDLLVNAGRSPLHRARARFVLRRSDLVHVDAAVLAEAAIRYGAFPERVWVRPWGVDVEALAPDAPWGARRRPEEPVRILWTRQLKPIYDPESMVRALGGLRRLGVTFRAVIAGGGPMEAALTALAAAEGVADWTRFEGFVDESRLAALYRDADLYVSLSLSDSTSQSLLEAMAAGLFPVVTDIAGNREWITHRQEGYLVPVRDPEAVARALAEAAREPDAERITDRARARVAAGGSFRATLDLLEGHLQSLAARAPSRGAA